MKYHVSYKGRDIYIAKAMIEKTGADLELLKKLFLNRLAIESDILNHLENLVKKQELIAKWVDNEKALQRAYGFKESANHHRFWRMSGCKCPVMDNEDNFGTEYKIINKSCPIHGDL